MALTLSASRSWTTAIPLSRRFRDEPLCSKRWARKLLRRITLPVPLARNRLAAALRDFNFGIVASIPKMTRLLILLRQGRIEQINFGDRPPAHCSANSPFTSQNLRYTVDGRGASPVLLIFHACHSIHHGKWVTAHFFCFLGSLSFGSRLFGKGKFRRLPRKSDFENF